MKQFLRKKVREILEKNGFAKVSPFPFLNENKNFLHQPSLENVLGHFYKELQGFKFLQIGGYDGVGNDYINEYIQYYSWQGVIIEPQPEAFLRLQEKYEKNNRIKLLNQAISEKNENRPLYRVNPKFAKYCHCDSGQLASFYRPHIEKHLIGLEENLYKDAIDTIDVECITISSILENHDLQSIDLLMIDCEGYDLEILSFFDFNMTEPKVIVFEYLHCNWGQVNLELKRLAEFGYKFVALEMDIIAYKENQKVII